MLKVRNIPLQEAGVLNRLLKDYINRKPELRDLYAAYPDLQGFGDWLKTTNYSFIDRGRLGSLLEKQAGTVENSSPQTLANIQMLQAKETYTVTTGHQLCLFTGPLYFIYKIFSAIVLSEKLKAAFPGNNFVPLYWMATEDHDFEEINHFIVGGKKITWQSGQTGAVGHFKTAELKALMPQIRSALGISASSKELITLFERAYLQHDNLALATRYLVNELFGQYGLVTIDGDDAGFKQQFTQEFNSDIFEQKPWDLVKQGSSALTNLDYHVQVNAREINCFYLEPGSRTRIEKNGNDFVLVGTDKRFTEAQLREAIISAPERISPNVVLRPLYQQKILPNIAYVGGPGELAYWLEFRAMFDHYVIPYPVLVPRTSVSLVNHNTAKTIQKLNLPASAIFQPAGDILLQLQKELHGVFALEEEESQLRKLFASILSKTQKIDPTLDGKVNADLQRSLNTLESIAGKTNRAIRRKMEDQQRMIRNMQQELMPGGIPQERVENFSGFYLLWQRELFEVLRQCCDPLSLQLFLVGDTV